jgi:hypothetical protein
MPIYRKARDAGQETFLSEAAEMYDRYHGADPEERTGPLASFTASCFERAAEVTAHSTEVASSEPVQQRPPLPFTIAWNILDRQADFAKE